MHQSRFICIFCTFLFQNLTYRRSLSFDFRYLSAEHRKKIQLPLVMHFLFTGIAFIVLGLAKSYPSLDDKDLDDERIVGGYLIHIEHAPYQVSWQNNFKGKFSHYCGGSLISEKFVLSAAHCEFSIKFDSLNCVT